MSIKYLAFITMEFYPLTTGEIGRYIHNMLVAMSSSDRARTVVILVGEALDLALVRTELGVSMKANCRHVADRLEGENRVKLKVW
jgi:hypothetical protein